MADGRQWQKAKKSNIYRRHKTPWRCYPSQIGHGGCQKNCHGWYLKNTGTLTAIWVEMTSRYLWYNYSDFISTKTNHVIANVLCVTSHKIKILRRMRWKKLNICKMLAILQETQAWADLHTWKLEARNRRLTFLSSRTWISNVKNFFRFLTMITKNGSFIPSVAAGSAGHVMYVDWIFDPIISSTLDCMSSSCGRLIWPSTTNKRVPKT